SRLSIGMLTLVIIMICSPAMTSSRIRAIFLALLAIPLSPPAHAQTVTGTIQGTVTDAGGGVLPGVSVTLTHVETGTERATLTNERGSYSAPFLQIGTYRVSAALQGFGTAKRDGIDLRLNETRVVDLKLDPRVTQEVTVTGEAPPINLTSGETK